jgi:hypothetical protein
VKLLKVKSLESFRRLGINNSFWRMQIHASSKVSVGLARQKTASGKWLFGVL